MAVTFGSPERSICLLGWAGPADPAAAAQEYGRLLGNGEQLDAVDEHNRRRLDDPDDLIDVTPVDMSNPPCPTVC